MSDKRKIPWYEIEDEKEREAAKNAEREFQMSLGGWGVWWEQTPEEAKRAAAKFAPGTGEHYMSPGGEIEFIAVKDANELCV